MERMVGIDTKAWNNPTETSSIITWNKVVINILIKVHLSFHEHLEKQVDVDDGSIRKDDCGQEGGEGTMEDMGTSPG